MRHSVDLFDAFKEQLSALAPTDVQFKVALSGGLDSVVLLHLLARVAPLNVSAQHVHHGLSDNADDWADFCMRLCAELGVSAQVTHVLLDKTGRTSLEALAREKRYAALKTDFGEQSYLLTAHHQDDQLETVLLALKRGAGLTGLQGIVAKQSLTPGYLIRPLLNFSREQLEQYAQHFDLLWIEDESNQDQQFDRNFIRHSITPLLKQRWPSITKTVARSAQHCHNQQQLINELSEADFKNCQLNDTALDIDLLLGLSATRRDNVLRYWFKETGLQYPSSKQLNVMWQDIVHAQQDATPKMRLQGRVICRYQRAIYLIDEKPNAPIGHDMVWQNETQMTLDCGEFQLQIDAQPVFLNQQHRVEVCFRGEFSNRLLCLPIGRDKSRSVKKLLHEYHVPPWRRDSIPFVFVNGELVAALGLFQCAHPLAQQLSITAI